MSLRSQVRKSTTRPCRARTKPRIEWLEQRLTPAVQLTYGGVGTVLGLQELVSGSTPNVSVSEPAAGTLKIDLGSLTFDASSTLTVAGLTYENANSPATSHFAMVGIGQANDVSALQAVLGTDSLALGTIANASGGLGGVTASAAAIVVTGLDTSHTTVGGGNVDLKATGPLTVAANAELNTGAGTLALAAGVNADGSTSGPVGANRTLTIASGAIVISENTGPNAITLKSDDISIDTSSNPAFVGADPVVGGPAQQTLSGVASPQVMAFDSHGNLFVGNGAQGGVTEFVPGSTVPFLTLGDVEIASALAFDSHGNLFVADEEANVVWVFAPGTSNPTSELTGLTDPDALAFDSQGNLYVANAGIGGVANTVSIFAPGSTTATGSLSQRLSQPKALAFDSHGNLYVGNAITGNGATAVEIFAPGSTTPTGNLNGPSSGDALSFDAQDNLYVVSTDDGTVSVFTSGNTNPSTVLTGLSEPSAVAFDAHGNVFVSNSGPGNAQGTVSVFAPGSTTATASISGLSGPGALLFDTAGNLYVGQSLGVSVFGPRLAAGGVAIQTANPDLTISVGNAVNPGSGLVLTSAELSRIFTIANGSMTFGDSTQTGDITINGVRPNFGSTTVVAIQSPTSPGKIVLDSSGEFGALNVGTGDVDLTAGTGGIVVVGGGNDTSTIVTAGKVRFDTTGGVGTIQNRVVFDFDLDPASVAVGDTNVPTGGVYLGSLAELSLANVQTVNATIDVAAAGDLTVLPGAVVNSGTAPLVLAAGIDESGADAETLTIGAGAALVSSNASRSAITLSGFLINVATGAVPATIGVQRTVGTPPVPVAGGVVLTTASPDTPITIGPTSGAGLNLSNAELAQIFTIPTGTITIGDPTQTGTITFAGATPISTPGASLAVVQSPTGPGSIVLDGTSGTALNVGTSAIQLTAGTGGISAKGTAAGLATTAQVSLDTTGGIGSAANRVLFDAVSTPSLVTVGAAIAPAGGVYLGGLGSLTVGDALTADALLDLTAAANLTVATNTTIDAGTAKVVLSAGVNPDGTGSSGGGTLAINSGANVLSDNTDPSAITLRGTDIVIDTSLSPAVVGLRRTGIPGAPKPTAGGVVVTSAQPDGAIGLGTTSGAGLNLSNAELAQIFTVPTGTITIGDPTQTGTITFAGATPVSTPAANLNVVQSPTGAGGIVLDGTSGTALSTSSSAIQLTAGTAGISAVGTMASLATTASVKLDTSGGIGTAGNRVLFAAGSTPSAVIVGAAIEPAGSVYLGGLGALTLGNVNTANTLLDATAEAMLTVAAKTTLDTGTGKVSLKAGANPDGTASASGGTLTIAAGAEVLSRNTSRDAITLLGTDTDIAAGAAPAIVGGIPSAVQTTPSSTLTGLNSPSGMIFDSKGNLYVANENDNTVSMFTPGSTTPAATLTGLNLPTGMAIDSSGNLYVANGNGTTISVFAPGATTPTSTLTGLNAPFPLVFDSQGNLYAGNLGTNTVSVFKPGHTTPTSTINGVLTPVGLAIDSDDNLYVANAQAATISVFGPNHTLKGTLTGVDGPVAITVDKQGTVYVVSQGANGPDNFVSIFSPGSTTPTLTLNDLQTPEAVAVDGAGNVYVANSSSSDPLSNTVQVFAPNGTTPIVTLTGLNQPARLAFDAAGNLYVSNGGGSTVSVFGAPSPTPTAGGVVVGTVAPDAPISVGATSGVGLVLSDAELGRLFTIAGGAVTIGDANYAGDITINGPVTRHPGYDTLVLQTQNGVINTADDTVLSVANLALQAGTGIGTTGALSIDVDKLAFTSQSGPIQLSDARSVTLASVDPLQTSSIPANIFSAPAVGDVFTILHSDGATGEISYQGRALPEGATLTLADGNHYRINYHANGGHDVTLTRVASLTLTPPPVKPEPPQPGVSLVGKTLVITGTSGDDVVRLARQGGRLRVFASFLPTGVSFLDFKRTGVSRVLVQLGAGNDRATVGPRVRLPVLIDGGAGDDSLTAGAARDVLIGGTGSDHLASTDPGRQGSLLIGDSTNFDANDDSLLAVLAEWTSARSRRTRVANLVNGTGSRHRLNGTTFLNTDTIADDGVDDQLQGNPRVDWLLTQPRQVVPTTGPGDDTSSS